MKKISIPTILLISIVSYCALIVFIQNFLLVDFSTLNYMRLMMRHFINLYKHMCKSMEKTCFL